MALFKGQLVTAKYDRTMANCEAEPGAPAGQPRYGESVMVRVWEGETHGEAIRTA